MPPLVDIIEPTLMLRFIKEPKGGDELRAAFAQPPLPKTPVVEEFLYNRKLTYVIADPSTGKTTLAIQIACSLAGASPVFGLFNVPKPTSTYYVAFETEWDEFQENCALIRKQFDYDPDLIHFDEEMLGVDVLRPSHAQFLIKKIERFKPGLVILDPIYHLVSGDLKEGAVASSLSRFLNLLATTCNCPVLPLHHTTKEVVIAKGATAPKDRSYGSRWLKAGATLWWQVTARESTDGVTFEHYKDRYKLSRKKFDLSYDPSTRCSMGQTGGKQYMTGVLVSYLNALPVNSEQSLHDLSEIVGCSPTYIYELLKQDVLKERLERQVRKDRRVVWKVLPIKA